MRDNASTGGESGPEAQSACTADKCSMTELYPVCLALLSCVFRQDQASLCDQCSKNRDEVIRLEAELEQERRRRSRMKNNMQEAAVTLRQALMVKQWH